MSQLRQEQLSHSGLRNPTMRASHVEDLITRVFSFYFSSICCDLHFTHPAGSASAAACTSKLQALKIRVHNPHKSIKFTSILSGLPVVKSLQRLWVLHDPWLHGLLPKPVPKMVNSTRLADTIVPTTNFLSLSLFSRFQMSCL